jgi:hypothetical protein
MMKSLRFLLPPLIALMAACTGDPKQAPDQHGPDPMITVHELLRLHDLLGKQPEERSQKTKTKEVPTASLKPLFVNLENSDPFLRQLYVGFVVGALARYQGRLFVSKHGNRAEVSAGKLKVAMKLKDGRYKIDLEKTIPEVIRQRAKIEKTRYQEAKKSAERR